MSGSVCLGGTFNSLHEGHLSMLRLAFAVGSRVYIGMTSDRMAASGREHVVPYEVRRRSLQRACNRLGGNFEISELEDPYGYATRLKGLRAIVVSEATAFRVREINTIREGKGFAPLISYVVPLLRSFNGIPLSSTRVLSGDCDTKGRLLRPLAVGIGSGNSVKSGAVRDAFGLYPKEIGRASFRSYGISSGVADQPYGAETIRGALTRARESLRDNDLGVGIEAGLFSVEELNSVYDVQYCVIIDRSGAITSGHGMGFSYPPTVLEEVSRGKTIGDVMSRVSGIRDIGSKKGAIGYLSRGRISRRQLTLQAVVSALIPRINAGLYADRTTASSAVPGRTAR